MKQQISLEQWQELPDNEQQFLNVWKQRKYPGNTELPNIGICLELLVALTYNFHEEESDGRFFNKLLTNAESVVGWEGAELIDILWFEVRRAIQKRLSSGTFNEPEPPTVILPLDNP